MAPASDPAQAGAVVPQGGVEVGDDHVVIGLPGLRENAAVGVQREFRGRNTQFGTEISKPSSELLRLEYRLQAE
jgi:hypothetical protein